jgi:hypothetical protein
MSAMEARRHLTRGDFNLEKTPELSGASTLADQFSRSMVKLRSHSP